MKRLGVIFGLISLFAAASCSSTYVSSTAGYGDDLYEVHDQKHIAQKELARIEALKAQELARQERINEMIASGEIQIVDDSYVNPYDEILADDYESAYARRLAGFSSPTYKMPSSYYNLRYGGSMTYATAYDPAFYNIMVSGDQVWVEPKFITSMFGSWGASSYYGGWYGGWAPTPYYSWWGYPRYSWWDWNYNYCYHDYWYGRYPYYGYRWGGHYHPYYAPHYHSYRPQRPHYAYRKDIVNRPGYNGSTSGTRYVTNSGVKSSSSTRYRYTAPSTGTSNRYSTRSSSTSSDRYSSGSSTSRGTSNFNRGSSTSTRSSSSSSSYNRGSSSSSSSSSYNRGSSSSSSSRSSGGSSSRNSAGR